MKTGLLLLLLILLQAGSGPAINRIAATNRLKKQAEEAYQQGKYAEAAAHYETLILKWGETTDAVLLNRANALLNAQKEEEAAEAYRQLIEGEAGKPAKSIALQQLGYLASQEERLPDALQYFKDALKANPGNETARINYELAWRELKDQQKEPKEPEEDKEEPEDKPQIQPSAWAMQQKAKADALYKQFHYTDALRLMQESLRQDSTVAAYNDYMSRLKDISEIDQ